MLILLADFNKNQRVSQLQKPYKQVALAGLAVLKSTLYHNAFFS